MSEPFDRTCYYWADDANGDMTLWRKVPNKDDGYVIVRDTELQALSPDLLALVKTGVYFTNWCHDTQQSSQEHYFDTSQERADKYSAEPDDDV